MITYIPIIEWGVSKSALKNREINDINSETSNSVEYKVKDKSIYVEYYFQSDKLIYSHVSLNYTNWKLLDVSNSLYERFDFITSTSSKFWFQKEKCFVMMRQKGEMAAIKLYTPRIKIL